MIQETLVDAAVARDSRGRSHDSLFLPETTNIVVPELLKAAYNIFSF